MASFGICRPPAINFGFLQLLLKFYVSRHGRCFPSRRQSATLLRIRRLCSSFAMNTTRQKNYSQSRGIANYTYLRLRLRRTVTTSNDYYLIGWKKTPRKFPSFQNQAGRHNKKLHRTAQSTRQTRDVRAGRANFLALTTTTQATKSLKTWKLETGSRPTQADNRNRGFPFPARKISTAGKSGSFPSHRFFVFSSSFHFLRIDIEINTTITMSMSWHGRTWISAKNIAARIRVSFSLPLPTDFC